MTFLLLRVVRAILVSRVFPRVETFFLRVETFFPRVEIFFPRVETLFSSCGNGWGRMARSSRGRVEWMSTTGAVARMW